MTSAPTQDYHEERTDTPSDCRLGEVAASGCATSSRCDPLMWRRLLNFLYLSEQDVLFVWAKGVQASLRCECEASAGAWETKA